jgi:uncharacterized protein YcfL
MFRMSQFHNCLLVVALSMTITGCSSDNQNPDLVKAPHTVLDDPLPKGAYPQIVVLDDLQRQVVGSGLIVDKADESVSRTMRVRATLRSVSDREVPVQYRFVFMGADGASLSDDTVWQSLNFAPRTERTLTGSAPNFQAVDWRLEVRTYR